MIAVCFFQHSVKAQSLKLHIVARPLPDSIVLRWAPTDFKTWETANIYGYKLLRYTISRDTSLLSLPVYKELANTIKVSDINAWESPVKRNKYAAIAAQALFGKTFDIDAGKGFNPENIYNKTKEQEQRFSFALFAADMSPEVAELSGLGFTDKTAKKNEKYLYRILINFPDSITEKSDTAFVFTGISDYKPLPAPVEFKAEFDDRLAKLSWNIFAQNKIYISWEIERSDDKGKNFKLITPDPIVPFFRTDDLNTEFAFKFDSLPQNNKEYLYRLRGVNPFGEKGAWSDVVKGKGTELIKAVANISNYETDQKSVTLHWTYPEDQETLITGFKVLRSEKHNTGFIDISGKIKAGKRAFKDKNPIGTAYYKIKTYKDTSAAKLSYPYLVQLTDNTPPKKPRGLTGTVDTTGLINLSWQANSDDDIYGYRVFRSASGNDEFSQLTYTPVKEAFFQDSINKKDLNRSVFYKIIAVDLRQNESEFSEIFELIKPDIIPPSVPVITETKTSNNGIFIKWINSSSSDVKKYEIYRKLSIDTTWQKIDELPIKKIKQESSYTDYQSSDTYIARYKIVAVDNNGNRSDASVSVDIKGLKSNKGNKLKKVSHTINPEKGTVLIEWKIPEQAVKFYKIYKKINSGNYTVYETSEGSENNFTDYKLKIGNTYCYRIKVIYKNGTVSGFSDEIKVQLK